MKIHENCELNEYSEQWTDETVAADGGFALL